VQLCRCSGSLLLTHVLRAGALQCQDMFDSVDDMISDYMDGYTVNL
jgi:hypothetical protein